MGTGYAAKLSIPLTDEFKEYSVVFVQESETNTQFTIGAESGVAVAVKSAIVWELDETFNDKFMSSKDEADDLVALHGGWFEGTKQMAGLEDIYNVTTQNIRKSRNKIYGIQFIGSNTTGVRTHDAALMVANVATGDEIVRNDFDEVSFYQRPRCNIYHAADGTPIVMAYEGEPGFSLEGAIFPPYSDLASVFYECKPCYWNGSFEHPQVTGTPMEGFKLFECFEDGETPLYLPSYWMAMVNGKATSISGTQPSYNSLNGHMTNARTYHANAHTETMAVHMYEYVLQMVEFGTRDLQTIMMGASGLRYNGADVLTGVISDVEFETSSTVGALFVEGQTISIGSTKNGSERSAGVVIESIVTAGSVSTFTLANQVANMAPGDYISSRAWRNGATDIVAASSGSPGSNASGKYPCIWRGKVDPWANAYSCICDILIQRTGQGTPESPYVYTPHYLEDPTKYNAGTLTADYVKLRFTLPGTDGYGKSLGVDSKYRLIGITDTLGASTTTYLADYYYYPRYEICVVVVGGNWYSGRSCGPVYFNCVYPPGDSSINRLARLFVAVKTGV